LAMLSVDGQRGRPSIGSQRPKVSARKTSLRHFPIQRKGIYTSRRWTTQSCHRKYGTRYSRGSLVFPLCESLVEGFVGLCEIS
jgi:hypothetical protein